VPLGPLRLGLASLGLLAPSLGLGLSSVGLASLGLLAPSLGLVSLGLMLNLLLESGRARRLS
jgi:hypothetical protein